MIRLHHFIRAAAIALALLISGVRPCVAQIKHEVFLPNTDHELHVYRIFGEQPGKTIMLIGGIQGDEPGSYMTADLYADVHLKKGNLIVVPRANFYSILLNQRNGITGDMNRKFDQDSQTDNRIHLEDEIVAILKHLIAESDCLLNLHEGSGFYAPVWLSDQENPTRFGQSIIYDTAVFSVPGENKEIRLQAMAEQVTAAANPQIAEPKFRFKPNNHETLSEKTQHLDQRKSATFYALTKAHIPAFGVETSKTIESLETKINLEKLVINAFMGLFGIVIDTPGVTIDQPKLEYLLVKVNDRPAFAMPHGSTLGLAPGDNVMVTDIIANYERGLVADIEGLGTTNDTNMAFRITKPCRIIVRKDAIQAGWVDLSPDPGSGSTGGRLAASDTNLTAREIVVDVAGGLKSVKAGESLAVKKGSRLILQSVKTNMTQLDSEVLLNFKGFAPPRGKNNGNDLNLPIRTDQDLWPRYSENRLGKRYQIEATYRDRNIGTFWIEIR